MTVNEIYRRLNEKIPPTLSCAWDNDGLMCCPNGSRRVTRVLVALDVTEAVVRYAIEGGYELIVSHHPMIFKGLKALNEGNFIAAKTMDLIRSGVSVMSFHTRLDAVAGGVNDVLAALLGLRDVAPFGEDGIGRIGILPEAMEQGAFARRVKDVLNAPVVRLADAGLSARRVAVLGGGGGDDVDAARAAGADTYVTGELKYHTMTDAPEERMNLIEAGHFHTENPVCETLRRWLLEMDPTLTVDLFDSYAIYTV